MAENDKIEKYCKYCEKATALSDPDEMLCERCGVVSSAHVCRRFRYDPLKRMPKRVKHDVSLDFVDVDEDVKPSDEQAPDTADAESDHEEERK